MQQPTDSEHFRAALGTIVVGSALPYGYTVSIWSSGALLIHGEGFPGVVEVFLFFSGALLGFAAVGSFAHGVLRTRAPMVPSSGHVLVGLLHWFSVGLAIGSVALIAEIPGGIAWPLGSFVATTLYLLGASVQLAVVTARATRVPAQPTS